MEIIERYDGKWILVTGPFATDEISFDTQQEAVQAMAKLATARAIVAAVQSLATATDSAADLEAEYFDAGSWADGDVSALGIATADLAACITLLQQIDALMSGNATSVAAYRATLNKVRRIT